MLVTITKRHKKAPHISIATLIALGGLTPLSVHALTFSSFTDKVRALFVETAEAQSDESKATSQNMDVFKPTIVDGTTTEDDASSSLTEDSLQAVSGSLRLSTEDIDYPLSDTISVYEVKQGDTIKDVAKLFNVSANTIIWANNLQGKSISKGDTLVILPITGIRHTVKKGDTLTSIAKRYKADQDDIATYNGLPADAALTLGDVIIVPDGEIQVDIAQKPKAKSKKQKVLNSYSYTAPQGFLARPLVGGRKTQGIHGHNGVDIAGTPGTPILASASGRVIVAKGSGYNGGYGNLIIIMHDKGVQTVYAHLRAVYVSPGQTVNQGDVIGELGNTGRSTGPHLHFEVRGAKNPF